MSLQPGDRVKHYHIHDIIAKGGMGVVWNAWDTQNHRPVAIKAVLNDLVHHPEFKIRILQEARRHQSLQHENIVSVLDVFESGGDVCIVMDLIEGISLDNLLASRENNRLDAHEAIPIIRDILAALNYAHKQAIVHRDVKPSNVLLNGHNRALLIDFGIALAVGEERLTRTGQTIGTPVYMSPEQITNPRAIYHLSDVYSAGCVLYEMLTGRPPFVKGQEGIGMVDFAIQQAHVKVTPVNPRNRVPQIPESLDKIVMSALEKDPEDRIPGCEEFIHLLEPIGQEPERPRNGVQPGIPPPKPFKKWLIVGLLIVLLCILLLFSGT